MSGQNTPITPIPSDLSDRTLTLNLILRSSAVVSLRSCEVLGRGFRNRLSFQEGGLLEDVLVARLAQAIYRTLDTVPDGAHVLSLPDFLVEVPGLALSGLHVMIMEASGGIRNAILRFKEFVGSVNRAFSVDIGFDSVGAAHAEKLAVSVLADICMPILNLCQSLDQHALATGERSPANITDRAREFQFQTELLKRFIFNADVGFASAAEPRQVFRTYTADRTLPR